MLPLISISEQQKQTKSTSWPRRKADISLQMCIIIDLGIIPPHYGN